MTLGILGRLSIGQKMAFIPGLFIIALVGILLYTIVTLQGQQSDAVVINLAGRQRMLNQRHLKEVLSRKCWSAYR